MNSNRAILAGGVALVAGVGTMWLIYGGGGDSSSRPGRDATGHSNEKTELVEQSPSNGFSELKTDLASPSPQEAKPDQKSEPADEKYAPFEIEYESGTVARTILNLYDSFKGLLSEDGKKQPLVTNQPFYKWPKELRNGHVFNHGDEGIVFVQGSTTNTDCKSMSGEFIDDRSYDIQWEKIGKVYYPTEHQVGPKQSTDGIRRCFDHSLPGVVIAAMNHLYQYPNIQEFEADSKQQSVVFEPYRNLLSEVQFRQPRIGSREGFYPEVKYVQPYAYRVLQIDRTAAKIIIYSAYVGVDGSVQHTESNLGLVWDKGDWRVALWSSIPSNSSNDAVYLTPEMEGKYKGVYRISEESESPNS